MKILHEMKFNETLSDVCKRFNVEEKLVREQNNIINNNVPKIIYIEINNENFVVVDNLKRNLIVKNVNNFEKLKESMKKNGFITTKEMANVGEKILFYSYSNNYYVVQIMDTLNEICNKFNLLKEDVMKKNNLKTERLFVGQLLEL